jgi:hypothetical protein
VSRHFSIVCVGSEAKSRELIHRSAEKAAARRGGPAVRTFAL